MTKIQFAALAVFEAVFSALRVLLRSAHSVDGLGRVDLDPRLAAGVKPNS